MKIKVLSIDVTPNGKCFQIETKSDNDALYATRYDVIPIHAIENASYDLSDAEASPAALTVLVAMNSRHFAR